MPVKYFMYTVHLSERFLIPRSLRARFYLMILRYSQQRYETAYKLVEKVSIGSLHSEERAILGMIIRAGIDDDAHPDAVAIKIKLAIKFPEFFTEDLPTQSYIIWRNFVSPGCRLSRAEEQQVLQVWEKKREEEKNEAVPGHLNVLLQINYKFLKSMDKKDAWVVERQFQSHLGTWMTSVNSAPSQKFVDSLSKELKAEKESSVMTEYAFLYVYKLMTHNNFESHAWGFHLFSKKFIIIQFFRFVIIRLAKVLCIVFCGSCIFPPYFVIQYIHRHQMPTS